MLGAGSVRAVLVQDCSCSAAKRLSSPCCLLLSPLLTGGREGLSCLLTETLATAGAGRYALVSVGGTKPPTSSFSPRPPLLQQGPRLASEHPLLAVMQSLQLSPHQSHKRPLPVVVITTQEGKQYIVDGKTSVIVMVCSVLIYIVY